MNFSVKISELYEILPNVKVSGTCKEEEILGLSNLQNAGLGDLSFLGNAKYRSQVKDCLASIILLPLDYKGEPRPNQMFFRTENPSKALAVICDMLDEKLNPPESLGIHASAFVETDAEVSETASIGAFTYIGHGSKVGKNSKLSTHCHVGPGCLIGEHCILHPGVKILSRCEIGNHVILNAGVVIGSEGYGFEHTNEGHQKIPHLGKVIIEDGVEIGANTCIDRARFEQTRISKGCKIDNLVQIGHNVQIGENCLIVAQAGISGSVTLEKNVIVGGQAGFAGHLRVGEGAKIAGQAGITKNVEAGAFLKGNPALPYQLAQRIAVLQKKLPDLFNRFAQEKLQD